jgi:hypothetical protein
MTTVLASAGLVLARRAATVWQQPVWDLVGDDGEALGCVVRDGSGYAVEDADGHLLLSVERRLSGRLPRYPVTDPKGVAVGEVEQENALFAPSFLLVDAEGATIRLDPRGSRTGPWIVADLAGQQLGAVTPVVAGPDALPLRAYRLVRGDGLGGEFWPLVVVAVLCVDLGRERR